MKTCVVAQHSSARMIVIIRSVTAGSEGSGDAVGPRVVVIFDIGKDHPAIQFDRAEIVFADTRRLRA